LAEPPLCKRRSVVASIMRNIRANGQTDRHSATPSRRPEADHPRWEGSLRSRERASRDKAEPRKDHDGACRTAGEIGRLRRGARRAAQAASCAAVPQGWSRTRGNPGVIPDRPRPQGRREEPAVLRRPALLGRPARRGCIASGGRPGRGLSPGAGSSWHRRCRWRGVQAPTRRSRGEGR
jgi:hypothetical protein